MRVHVRHSLGDLVSDLEAIPPKAALGLARAVEKNAEEGNRLAQGFARDKAGPHGKAYYKRVTAEQVTALSWEYGPEGEPKTEFVGAGFRHGVNLDLPNSADIIGPKLADDVVDVIDRLFW